MAVVMTTRHESAREEVICRETSSPTRKPARNSGKTWPGREYAHHHHWLWIQQEPVSWIMKRERARQDWAVLLFSFFLSWRCAARPFRQRTGT